MWSLPIRLETIGNCLIGSAALVCAITQQLAGYVGVERINQYSNKNTIEEKPDIIAKNRPPKNWAKNGEIIFNNVYIWIVDLN